jgi:hypothetical protein
LEGRMGVRSDAPVFKLPLLCMCVPRVDRWLPVLTAGSLCVCLAEQGSQGAYGEGGGARGMVRKQEGCWRDARMEELDASRLCSTSHDSVAIATPISSGDKWPSDTARCCSCLRHSSSCTNCSCNTWGRAEEGKGRA